MCQNYVCQDGEPVYLYVYLGVPPAEDGRGGWARMYVCISGCAAAEAGAGAGQACMLVYQGVPQRRQTRLRGTHVCMWGCRQRRAGAGAGHARVFLTVSYKTGARAWAGQWAKW